MRMRPRKKSGIKKFGKRAHLLGNTRIRKRQTKKRRILEYLKRKRQNLPLRNAHQPLIVIFVCSEGFSSGAYAKQLGEISKKMHLPIISTNSHVTEVIKPKADRIKYRLDEVIRHETKGADIIIHPFYKGSWSLSKLLKCIPQNSVIMTYKDSQLEQPNMHRLLKVISEKFRFE